MPRDFFVQVPSLEVSNLSYCCNSAEAAFWLLTLQKLELYPVMVMDLHNFHTTTVMGNTQDFLTT